MPTFEKDGKRIPFAGRDELLAYANRIREAGGANALDALLPSKPGQAHACLIANALNFGCEVRPIFGRDYPDGSQPWAMRTADDDTTRRLAKRVNGRTLWVWFDGWEMTTTGPSAEYEDEYDRFLVLLLPKRIGNAADAFDNKHPEFDGLRA